jgi:hypothetical protein
MPGAPTDTKASINTIVQWVRALASGLITSVYRCCSSIVARERGRAPERAADDAAVHIEGARR